uniref:Uncharacterized protein n=1 Tax=Cacopsylla melanoneura TaxID=428564 RepID=A0A8D8M9J5_9HEMI
MKAIRLDLLHKCTHILSTLILDILRRSQLHICIFLCLFPSVLHIIICHNSHSVRCSSQYYCLFLNIEHFHHEGRILSARRLTYYNASQVFTSELFLEFGVVY